MHKYIIYDVWMALKLSSKNFFSLIFIFGFIILGCFLYLSYNNIKIDDSMLEKYIYLSVSIVLIVFFQSVVIYFANRKYIIDLNTNLISFPRSDIENSILAIVLLFPYWNLMRTITINALDIENIYLDTKRWSTKHQVINGSSSDGKTKYRTETKNHILYTLNITGTFGSANLQFLSRQKRDEVRNAIQQCIKQCSNKNIDKKVSEFD